MISCCLLIVPGSLRERSFNRALARAAADLLPDGVDGVIHELHDLPAYNADLDADENRPVPVRRFKDALGEADAVVLVTPEYNHGIPGVLKNALDWASRPAFRGPLSGKKVAIMGASGGKSGTLRAQEGLRLLVLSLGGHPFPRPGVAIRSAKEVFGDDLELPDGKTRDFTRSYLHAFVEWAAPQD